MPKYGDIYRIVALAVHGDAAEDITRDVLIKSWKKIDTLREYEKYWQWVEAIIGNETYSYDTVTDEEELTEYYHEDSSTGLAGEIKKEISNEDGVQKSTTSYTYGYSDDGRKTERMTESCGGVTTVTSTVTDVMGRELSTSVSALIQEDKMKK